MCLRLQVGLPTFPSAQGTSAFTFWTPLAQNTQHPEAQPLAEGDEAFWKPKLKGLSTAVELLGSLVPSVDSPERK